jgi:hypothetical protein
MKYNVLVKHLARRTSPRRIDRLPPGYLTRKEFLQRSGITDSEMRGLIAEGRIRASRRSKRGWALYTEADVEHVIHTIKQQMRREDLQNASFTAEQAAMVYDRLDKGKKRFQIVMELKLHPFIVQAITREYRQETGGVFLPKEAIEKIAKQPIDGVELPIRSAEQIVEAIVSACREQACDVCKRRACASSCRSCIRKELEERAKKAATVAPVAPAESATSQAAE